MRAALLHRRLTVGMGLASLLAFAGGAGFEVVSTALAALALVTALFWHPSPSLSRTLEHLWLPLAAVLVARALAYVFVLGGDVVIPVVDLLLLLLCAEALRALETPNDARLYALTFALLLAATAYRPGILFAVAFVAYVVLGTVATSVGHLRRRAGEFGTPEPHIRRRFLLGTGALSGVVLVVSIGVFLTFPRVSRAWSGRGDTMATSVVGFSDEVSLGQHGATLRSNPEIVLRVEFPDSAPANTGSFHWRGRSYDHFDGVRWSRSRGMRPSAGITEWYEAWGDSLIEQKIYAAPLDVRVLFALHPVLDIDAQSEIHPLFDNVGDFVYWGGDTPVYTAVSVAGRPHPDSLRGAERGYMPDRSRYLQLPDLPDRIRELADSLTAGHETRYDKAVAVERWLRTEFEYTRELPATARQTGVDYFLFERRAGHCEYFSTAMALLLRSVGIHARNVNGFLGGTWSEFGRYLAVSQNEAHSWVEVWVPGYGWVDFDPTPPGVSDGTASGIWMWPGRYVFDALQHRWSKWVLDYSVDDQSSLLQGLFGGDRQTVDPVSGDEGGTFSWTLLWGALAAAVVTGAALLVFWRRDRGRTESRLYRELVRVCRRAGLAPGAQFGPDELVEALSGHPAAGPARELVSRYVAARFGEQPLGPGDRSAMESALGEVRRRLRGGGDATA